MKIVDWNESPLVRWLGTITRKRTKSNCKTAFKAYTKRAQVDEKAVEVIKQLELT